MDPRREALDRVGSRYDVRVLEPSPPAVADPPWYADDPVARGRPRRGLKVVSPVPTGDLLWEDLAAGDPALAEWCADRWLAAYRPLQAPPATLGATRTALHRVAEHVVAPTRQRANGKFGLRWTRGGFGTPFFGNDVQVRVEGDLLIVQVGGREQRGRLISIKDAAEFVGFDLTRFDLAEAEQPLDVDPAAGRWLGDLFGFGCSILEELRAEAPPEGEPSRVQLWPEHFDLAVDIGDEEAGMRTTFGISPGDDEHPEPYLYASRWTSDGYDALPLAEVLDAPDQRAAALAFFRERVSSASR